MEKSVPEQHPKHKRDDKNDPTESAPCFVHARYPNEQSFYCGSCPHTEACGKWHWEAARRSVCMAA